MSDIELQELESEADKKWESVKQAKENYVELAEVWRLAHDKLRKENARRALLAELAAEGLLK